MAVSAYPFGQYYLNLQKDLISDLSAGATTIKCALIDDTYTLAQNRHDCWSAAAWQADTAYSLGDKVIPTTANGHIYECISEGTSDSSEPSWPTTDEGTVVDGGATWECIAYGDISYYEVSGTGYTAGGEEITSKTLAQTAGATALDGDNVGWTSVSITARWAVVYEDTPTDDEDKKLLGFVDFGENKQSSGADFDIEWDSDGILITTATQVS